MRVYDRTDKSETPRCNQCGSQTPELGFRTVRITHRGRDEYTGKQVVVQTDFTVCKGTPCGGHLQMAHEG